MKANFIDNNDIFFFKQEKNCNVPDFSIYLVSCRVKTRTKILQDSEVFALKLEDASLAPFFFFCKHRKLHRSIVLCGKGLLLSYEKSSEGALYSMPALAPMLPFLMTSPYRPIW